MAKKPTASAVFPREYMLRVYNQAVEHGHIMLSPIGEEAARSFTMSFYRLRRRSDSSNATFILPEYHLVTVGKWKPDNGGTLPIYYNTVSEDDDPLPSILPVKGSAINPDRQAPAMPDLDDNTEAAYPSDAEDVEDIDDYVARLVAESKHEAREINDD